VARLLFRGEHAGHTLQPSALVSEVWLRILRLGRERFQTRAQFLAYAGACMRRLLIDHARRRNALKRGGKAAAMPLSSGGEAGRDVRSAGIDAFDLHEALRELAAVHPRSAQVVELRYLAQLSVDQVAECMRMSPGQVRSDFDLARGWLRHRLRR
jgi:RNA polymerase sigma-70 factor, ECF subfamily